MYGCSESHTGPYEVNVKGVRLTLPANWEVQDSDDSGITATLTDGNDLLLVGIGKDAATLEQLDSSLIYYSNDTINGKAAVVVYPRSGDFGPTGIYINDLLNRLEFMCFGHRVQDSAAVMSILRSVKFQHSDTTLNTVPFPSEKLVVYPTPGALLHLQNCVTCHRLDGKKMTAPGFATVSGEDFDRFFFDQAFADTFKVTGEYEAYTGPKYHQELYQFSDAEFQRLRSLMTGVN